MRSRGYISLLWLLGALAFMAGCQQVLAPANPAARLQDNLEKAIEASGKGRAQAAQRHLVAAVNASMAMGMQRSSAQIYVAQHLMERAELPVAVNFLDEALKDEEVRWDPYLWGTLARALGRFGDSARAADAEREASRRADKILAGGGPGEGGGGWKYPPAERYTQAGWYYYEREDVVRAARAWRRAVGEAPDNPLTLNLLGYLLADKGTTREEFQEALELTRKAMDLAPGRVARPLIVVDSYGWALYRIGRLKREAGDEKGGLEDLKSARRLLRQSVDGEPDQPEIRYHLGVVYAELGMVREAENEFARAIRLKPDYQEARRAQEALTGRREDLPVTPAPKDASPASPGEGRPAG